MTEQNTVEQIIQLDLSLNIYK